MQNTEKNKGFAALFIVILVSAAALIMAQNSAFLGIGELDSGFVYGKAETAFSVADGCMESAFSQLRKNNNYGNGGTINISVLGGSCIINISQSGNDRTISVEGISGDYHRKIESDVTVGQRQVVVNSWSEVSN